MTTVELAPELSAPTVGMVVAAVLLLAGHTVGRDLAILSLYAWLASQQ